jgi:hypothetical protein
MYKSSLVGFNPFKYLENRHHQIGHMSDVVDSPVFRDHTADMHAHYVQFRNSYVGVAELVEFSLCLSLFYDGDKLYKRSNDGMWPLLASVLNCDPSYRSKMGLGLFSLCLHNLPVGSPAEQSIIDDLVTEELKQLENGIVFEFKDDNGDLKAVFIQARSICWNVDTRAYEKVFHSSTSPSHFGCPRCGDCHGLSRTITGAPAYIGATLFLDENHALRHLARNPMPPGYFGEDEKINKELGVVLTAAARRTRVRGDGGDIDAEAAAEEDMIGDNYEDVVIRDPSSLRGPHPLYLPRKYTWVSEKFPYRYFSEAIDSAVTDTRPQRPLSLIHHDEYVDNAREGLKLELEYFLKKGKFPKDDFVVNNVASRLSAWVVLKAPLFHESPFDIMHNANNIIGYIFEWIIGTRACDTNSRKLSRAQERFVFFENRKILPGWRAGQFSRQWADSVNRCMNVPTVYKRDYSFDLPLKYSCNMNSHQTIMFMLAFCDYFMSFLDISTPYYHLYCRYAYDLRQAMKPFVKIGQALRDQVTHVAETCGLFSSMLPDSQQPFVIHQFLEIVNSIQDTGPSKSTACFTGERFMGKLAQVVTDGGQKYIVSVKRRIVAQENSHDENYKSYDDNKAPYLDNTGKYSNMVLKLIGRVTSVVLNLEIKSRLFCDIHEFLASQEINQLVLKSPFVRLFYTFESAFASWKKTRASQRHPTFPATFASWIHELYSVYTDTKNGDFCAAKVAHLVSDVRFIVFGASVSAPFFDEDELAKISDDVMRDVVDPAILYIADFTGIIRELAEFGTSQMHPLAGFIHGIVKGVKLTGRGVKMAEETVDEIIGDSREFRVTNPENILKDNWHYRFQVNSWCHITDHYVYNRTITSRTYYGQINYMFRMFVPSDNILHGCAFANMCVRRVSCDERRGGEHYVSMNDGQSYVADKHFVSLNYIESTAVATSALDELELPLMNPSSVRKNMKFSPKQYKLHFSNKSSNELRRLYFIDLHKERQNIEYGTVEDDEHNTKVFEDKVLQHHEQCGRLL